MATISNVNGKKITKIKYKGEIYDTGGSGGSDVNPLQHIIDNHKGDNQPSGEDLFYEYWGSSLDDAINSCDFSGITSAKKMFFDCKNLVSVPLFNTSNVTDMQYMFSYCKKLITIPQLNTSNVTNMSYMFTHCESLTTISQLNTSNVTDMSYMFNNCTSLTTIPQLDTSSVTNMSVMFYYCNRLTTISQLNTSSVTNMSDMFTDCSNLTTIPQLDTSNVTTMSYMFSACNKLTTIDITHMANNNTSFAYNCNSLTKLIIRNMDTIPTLSSSAFDNCYHFTGITSATYNPQGLKDGRIYVPDDKVEALKTATNWSVYADIIVPLSTLVE